jgi:hypothetical protein
MKSIAGTHPGKPATGQGLKSLLTRALTGSALVLALAGAGAGCAWEEMRPGERCGACHDGGEAKRFGASGTVYGSPTPGHNVGIPGVTVDITDAEGRSVSLRSNEAGNFYTEQQLVPPLQVTLSRAGADSISSTAISGDCNACHTSGSSPGRAHIP